MIRALRLLPGLFLALAVLTGRAVPPSDARAQDTGRIAATVNEDAITMLDILQRMDLIFATSGIENTPETRNRLLPQVLRALIDERLKLQEAARERLDDAAIDFDRAYSFVERNLGLPSGQLIPFIDANGLSVEALNRQLTAETVWTELVERRMRPDEITDEDIDAELERLRAAADQPSFRLAEIFLAVDEPSREAEVEASMLRLRDAILAGADFRALASQFSQGSSRNDGGELGWIVESQLSNELAAVVPSLRPDELSNPIRVIGGFSIVLLIEKRVGFEARPQDADLVLRQVTFPIGEGEDETAAIERAAAAGAAIGSCDDLDSLGEADPGLSVGSPVSVRLSDLQPAFQQAVAPLSAGQTSAPVPTAQGAIAITVCSREENSGLPSREDIFRRLRAERGDLVARGYLRDLRGAAFVDIRI